MKTFRLFARRLAVVAAATLAGTAAILAIGMTPAYAHHSTINGEPECDTTTGNWIVHWTVKNSQSNKFETLIFVSFDPSGSTLSGIGVGTVIPKPFGTVSGDQTGIPGSATSATLTVKGKWENLGRGSFIETKKTKTITFTGTCLMNMPKPHAVFASNCNGSVTVTLQNDADATATAHFHVTADAGFSKDEDVAPGGPDKVVNVPEASAGNITVKQGSALVGTYSWVEPESCEPLAVSSVSTCDELIVNVENPQGSRTRTFTITSGGTSEEFQLAGGQNQDFPFPGGTGVSVTVTLKGAKEGTTFTWEQPRECVTPTPTTTPPLPVTGASLSGLIGVAVALVVVGAALLLVLRFRRRLGES